MSIVAMRCKDIGVTLGSTPINPSWIRRGEPVSRSVALFGNFDRTACTVVWECTPGEFDWHYDRDETILILEGSVLLNDGVTPPRRVGAGDVVLFPAGAVVHWTVEAHVRKLAFFARPSSRPVALARRAWRKSVALLRGKVMASAPVRGDGRDITPTVDVGLA